MRLYRDAAHPYGLLQTAARDAQGVAGEWKTVLDVAELRKREGIPFELQVYSFGSSCLAPEYARCLLRLSPGGGDEVEVREFDLATARFVDGGFRVGQQQIGNLPGNQGTVTDLQLPSQSGVKPAPPEDEEETP